MTTVDREVRDEQHGTTTGYAYGCRCYDCTLARREWRRAHSDVSKVGVATVERVYEALEHESDLDGLVTATGDRLGELAGVSRPAAQSALQRLCEAGRIHIVGRTSRGGVLEIQLEEF